MALPCSSPWPLPVPVTSSRSKSASHPRLYASRRNEASPSAHRLGEPALTDRRARTYGRGSVRPDGQRLWPAPPQSVVRSRLRHRAVPVATERARRRAVRHGRVCPESGDTERRRSPCNATTTPRQDPHAALRSSSGRTTLCKRPSPSSLDPSQLSSPFS
ncbi:serine/arginine-rich splicing factor SR45-like [Iris pallida]|uniref:Serine/arginine-rich splicing factor SR45-like n=1 Tax=Iris pallida TaxID=29817 RepID=A0AAX6DG31_IRIPA|nr:serine/arginine-rich splicing factor SR45-like [Iris pallida]